MKTTFGRYVNIPKKDEKTSYFRDNFIWVEVSEEEQKQLSEELRLENNALMIECLKDAFDIGKETGYYDFEGLAKTLFDKRARAFYTICQAYLDNKVKELRDKK